MPAPVTFTLTLAPLPLNFSGTPQQWATALVDRLTVAPSTPWSAFITGSTIPLSDYGPLLYNAGSGNKEWRVFDTNTGLYTYLTVNGAGIVASSVPVTKLTTDITYAKTVLTFNASGVPTLLGGTLGYTLQMGASGPAFVDATMRFYPARARESVAQTVAIDTNLHKVLAATELYDPNSVYDPTNSWYVAPSAGYYMVVARAQVDNAGGTSASMELAFGTGINGNAVLADRISDGTSVASPPGDRWYVRLAGIVQLALNDHLEIYLSANDTVNSGNISVSAVQFNVYKIQ